MPVCLDLVLQSEPEGSPLRLEAKSSLAAGAAHIVSEEGLGALLKGAGPTFTGYFMQGSLKYGLYQVPFSHPVDAATAAHCITAMPL